VRRIAASLLCLLSASPARAEHQVDALELRVRTRDGTEEARASIRERSTAMEALRERSWLHERWLLAGGTAVVEFEGGEHPLGDRSRIVLQESGDRAELFRVGLGHTSLPPRALGDLLEGGTTWRSGYEVLPQPSSDEPPQSKDAPWSRWIRQQARTGSWHRAVTTRIQIWHRRATPAEVALARMAVDLIALPHLGDEGRRTLRREAAEVGVPLRWRLEVADESLAGRTAIPVLDGEVLSCKVARAAESTLSLHAPRYQPVVHDVGGLLGSRAMLARLGSAGERPSALGIMNRTPFHLDVLADGASFARVGPHSEIRMEGLPAGYYRLYARSRYGTFVWGPRDQYVPGSMTVTLP